MPIAKVQLPDGRIGRFEVPEGTTPEQVLEFAAQGSPEKSGIDWFRTTAEIGGGMIGGALGFASPVPGGAAIGTGLGAAAGGQIADLIQGKETSLKQAAIDTGVNAVIPAAVERFAPVAKNAIAAPFRAVKNRLTGATAAQNIADYAVANIPATAGAISGNKTMQGLEEMLSGSLGGGRIMQTARQATSDATEQEAKRVAGSLGRPMSRQQFGETAQVGARKAAAAIKSRAEKAYAPLDEIVQPGDIVPVTNTYETLAEILKGAPTETGAPIKKELIDIMNRLEADVTKYGGLPYSDLKALRGKLGDAVGGASVLADTPTGLKKLLYGALKSDSDEVAKKAGVYGRIDMANKWYANMKDNTVPVLDRIIGASEPEKVMGEILSSSKVGGSKLRILKRNLPEKDFDSLSATIFENLGKATPGAQGATSTFEIAEKFSPSTFMTNWNKLAPEAKAVLFNRPKYKDVIPNIDRFLRISGSQKDALSVANTSNTGRFNQLANYFTAGATATGSVVGSAAQGNVGAGVGALAGFALKPAAENAAARLITKPWFSKWLADGAQISATSPTSMGSHLARLPVLAKKNKDGSELQSLLSGDGLAITGLLGQ